MKMHHHAYHYKQITGDKNNKAPFWNNNITSVVFTESRMQSVNVSGCWKSIKNQKN